MTIQQRKASALAPSLAIHRRGFEPVENDHPASLWEEWFRHAPAPLQAEMLALAGEQGFLHSHQLPALANGNASKLRTEPSLYLWQQLLAGKCDHLKPVAARTFEPIDKSLSAEQTCAVSRALASPDLCLFQIPPAVDPIPVLTEIVEQEAHRRHRVVILANQATRLDGLVQRLQEKSQLFVLRYPTSLGADWAHGGTDAQKQAFRERILTRARTAHREADERCLRRGREARLWDSLHDWQQQIAQLGSHLSEARRRLDSVPAQVEQECAVPTSPADASPADESFAARANEMHRRRHEERKQLHTQLQHMDLERDRLEREIRDVNENLARLQEPREALLQKRWWTLTYWKAKGHPEVLTQFEQLEAQRDRLTRERSALEQPRADLERRARECEVQAHEERVALIAAESARRQVELEQTSRGHEQEKTRLEELWREACRAFHEAESTPVRICPDALKEAHAGWQTRRQLDEEACKFAGHWFKFLEDSISQFLSRMPGFAPVVAGTARVLVQHPDFTDAPEPWDLLLILDADESTEPDILRLVRKARRVLLLGGPMPSARNGLLSSSTFHRLWGQLVGDRSHLHYAWRREGDRWSCHLRTVAAEERKYLEAENLADFPEIELRILALPAKRPVLAQVLFPRDMDLAQAKAFIFSELQELAIEGAHAPLFWRETADAWVLHCGALEHEPGPAFEIDRGVREHLRGSTTQTAALHFSKAQGWSAHEAAEWVNRLLNLRDLGRVFPFAAKPG